MSSVYQHTLATTLVPGPIGYRVLRPDDFQGEMPLLLLLHGGGGSSEFLVQMQPHFDAAWAQGLLPPMVVATLDAGRSFYLDFFDESQKWETLVTSDWLNELRNSQPVFNSASKTVIAGLSMGGHGSVRIAMKNPEMFHAIAAMEPAIMPALKFSDVPPDNLEFQQAVLEERYGSPPDNHWNENNPAQIAIDKADQVKRSGLNIYLEVGADDFLLLNEGTEFMHRTLVDLGIKHEYRVMLGGNHVGNSIAPRFKDMLGFIGRTLVDPVPDPFLESILANRAKAESKNRG